jgi:hypothetical protein
MVDLGLLSCREPQVQMNGRQASQGKDQHHIPSPHNFTLGVQDLRNLGAYSFQTDSHMKNLGTLGFKEIRQYR